MVPYLILHIASHTHKWESPKFHAMYTIFLCTTTKKKAQNCNIETFSTEEIGNKTTENLTMGFLGSKRVESRGISRLPFRLQNTLLVFWRKTCKKIRPLCMSLLRRRLGLRMEFAFCTRGANPGKLAQFNWILARTLWVKMLFEGNIKGNQNLPKT